MPPRGRLRSGSRPRPPRLEVRRQPPPALGSCRPRRQRRTMRQQSGRVALWAIGKSSTRSSGKCASGPPVARLASICSSLASPC
eukprot:12803002-Alexandrium_andersonii.AAC.1